MMKKTVYLLLYPWL